MCEVLLIEQMLSPCGWVKSAFVEQGCKVTRVLHIEQALLAIHQTSFDLLVMAYDDAKICLLDVERLKTVPVLPLMVLLPDRETHSEMASLGMRVDCLISDTIPRERLWLEAKTALANNA
ncbi:DNA-binding response regulator [Enterovibrio sp. ZSDZ35]|uniref:DNA-binding response regulator n=1 Tax=Enterovibrio qingdaonensis TaxID=2899818 RepID=A0ABT5QJ67_9GAMM|nr:DNA-binding response regulator [Enterovibrio sp. ZSDZ35]MDD1781029.1 DNA-binding response regulator [Enterovibrio sp. ZSDZ35]